MSAPLAEMLRAASVEVSARSPHLDDLRALFRPGTQVTITALPGDDWHDRIATARHLRAAGFRPVPHVSAREVPSREAFAEFLAKARGEADVRRLLVIAGDVARARGPFESSLALLRTGLVEQAGIARVSVAGHPEGHPQAAAAQSFADLRDKQAWGAASGVAVDIVTQFCFEARPYLDYLAELARHEIALPVTVGLAGPASPATLLKFALRCGIGNSLRALRGQIGRFGRLLTDADPGDVVRGLAAAPEADRRHLAGLHVFPFGGLRKAATWLASMQTAPLAELATTRT